MKFLHFLRVGRPLCFKVYPSTLAASTWYMDVFEPGWISSCVIDPRCCLCDLFLPLFLQHVSVFLFCLFISSISSCRHRTMLRFSGYRQGCASGSWSDMVKVICRDHCGSVCPGCVHDHMSY
jgi:hypothetical protein